MLELQKSWVRRATALLLTILLLSHPSYSQNSQGRLSDAKETFEAALQDYHNELYALASAKLEQSLHYQELFEPEFKARIIFLLGASYEMMGNMKNAREWYTTLKQMRENGAIGHIPAVPGVDTEKLNIFREVFEETYFQFREPIPAAELLDKNVLHAPRKTIEKKRAEKRKKKFPWLIAVGAVVVIGTVALLLLSHKSTDESTNPLPVEWIRIPAGEFLMGDNFNEGEADELPVHKVYLDEYYISKYEITWSQIIRYYNDIGINRGAANRTPATHITWQEAMDFCNWLSRKTGENINLPTEAQWEKAAGGTYRYRYPWGNSEPNCGLVNYAGCELDRELDERLLKGVGVSAQGISPYGVYNMAGNASEWCRDWYDASYYSVSPKNNPTGPAGGSFRVVRGGNLNSEAAALRSANRFFYSPDYSGYELGFRIVKEK